jgi:hypothetical protein
MVTQRVLAARSRLDSLQERKRVPSAVSVVCQTQTQTKHSLAASNYEFLNPFVV